MLTVGKVKKLINSGRIFFTSHKEGGIICFIYNTGFIFLDPAKNVSELFNNNSLRAVSKKVLKNLKVLKKYRTEKYNVIMTCISVK